jgi:hypothetical protein
LNSKRIFSTNNTKIYLKISIKKTAELQGSKDTKPQWIYEVQADIEPYQLQ